MSGGSTCRVQTNSRVIRPMPHRSAAIAFAAVAIVAGAILGFAGWPLPNRMFEYSGLVLAAILISAFAKPRPSPKDWTTVAPAFVVEFIALLLLGPNATMLVALAGT